MDRLWKFVAGTPAVDPGALQNLTICNENQELCDKTAAAVRLGWIEPAFLFMRPALSFGHGPDRKA
jgi:hypothetical protein